MVALILFMLPTTEAQYDYVTDLETDTFNVSTGVGVTTASVQLNEAIYDDDTDTISLSSNDTDDAPTYSSYNATNRNLTMSGLSENTTRTITVTYDVYSLSSSGAVDNFVSKLDLFWLIVIIAFPIAAIAAVVIGRA